VCHTHCQPRLAGDSRRAAQASPPRFRGVHGSAKRARSDENRFSTNRSNEQRPFGHRRMKTTKRATAVAPCCNGARCNVATASLKRAVQRARCNGRLNELIATAVFQRGKRATKRITPKRGSFRCLFQTAVGSGTRLAEPWRGRQKAVRNYLRSAAQARASQFRGVRVGRGG